MAKADGWDWAVSEPGAAGEWVAYNDYSDDALPTRDDAIAAALQSGSYEDDLVIVVGVRRSISGHVSADNICGIWDEAGNGRLFRFAADVIERAVSLRHKELIAELGEDAAAKWEWKEKDDYQEHDAVIEDLADCIQRSFRLVPTEHAAANLAAWSQKHVLGTNGCFEEVSKGDVERVRASLSQRC